MPYRLPLNSESATAARSDVVMTLILIGREGEGHTVQMAENILPDGALKTQAHCCVRCYSLFVTVPRMGILSWGFSALDVLTKTKPWC